MLYIFDKDDTLIGSPGNRPANTTAEQKPLPGVVARLAELRAQGHSLAIATNQGGVAWGFISLSTAYALARDAARKVGGMDEVVVCPCDPRADPLYADPLYAVASPFRKPAPGMLKDLMWQFNCAPADTVFVGDRESDRLAAEAAGVRFEWAIDFFRGE